MKKLALAIALAFGSTLAFATDDAKKAEPSATGDKEVTATPTPQQPGQPSGSSVGDDNAGAFWTENARGGYMTKDQAMKYEWPQGHEMDWTKLDSDKDDRVSQTEWNAYHEAFAQKEGGPKEAAGERAGAAGPAGAPEPAPSSK